MPRKRKRDASSPSAASVECSTAITPPEGGSTESVAHKTIVDPFIRTSPSKVATSAFSAALSKTPTLKLVEKLEQGLIQEALNSACGCCLDAFAETAENSNETLAFVGGCFHPFHFKCIKKWSLYETSCPQCKLIFTNIAEYRVKDGVRCNLESCEIRLQADNLSSEGISSESSSETSDDETPQRPRRVFASGSRRRTRDQASVLPVWSQSSHPSSAPDRRTRQRIEHSGSAKRDSVKRTRVDAAKAKAYTEKNLSRLPYHSVYPRRSAASMHTEASPFVPVDTSSSQSFSFVMHASSATPSLLNTTTTHSASPPTDTSVPKVTAKPVLLRKRSLHSAAAPSNTHSSHAYKTYPPPMHQQTFPCVTEASCNRTTEEIASNTAFQRRSYGSNSRASTASDPSEGLVTTAISQPHAPSMPAPQQQRTENNRSSFAPSLTDTWEMHPVYEEDFLLHRKL